MAKLKVKKNPKPPLRTSLCAWCQKIVKVRRKGSQVVTEIPIGESGFTVKDFALHGSHGICTPCGKLLKAEAKAIKNPEENPPTWVRDKAKWREAAELARVSYTGKRSKSAAGTIYAVAVTIYKNLGGRLNRKGNKNPSEREYQAVVDLYNEFFGFEPDSVLVTKVKSLEMPSVLTVLGELVEVTYKSDKFDGRKRLYFHKFRKKDRPVLAASSDGQLFIIGGSYKISDRGIEG